MDLRCRPGDLAVIVFAENPQNVGLIVRVIKRNSGRSRLALKGRGPLWSVECAQPLTYTLAGKYIFKTRAPVPDAYMKPIRGGAVPAKSVVGDAPIVCTLL